MRRFICEQYCTLGFGARPNQGSGFRVHEPYIGFGADAHSFDGALRWQNTESAADYVARWQRGEPFHTETTTAIATEEKFFVGLRLAEGIRPSPEEWIRYRLPITQFLSDGLLERQGDTLRLTDRGVMLSNEVFQEFIAT